MTQKTIAIIGGGPAGLMAAQHLVSCGFRVDLFEAMPSVGRKFLMAGKSGMNITHSEDLNLFLSRYGNTLPFLEEIIRDFTPDDIRNWASALGIETFVGSSGRVFPTDFKAAPLLRAWLRDLKAKGLSTHMRHRWCGWHNNHLLFTTPDGPKTIQADAYLFAMGGISWPALGGNGDWIAPFDQAGLPITPFKASNCGFNRLWSPYFLERFAGAPVKPVGLSHQNKTSKGEFIISKNGVEGSAIYPYSRTLCDEIEREGSATLYLDLTPDRPLSKLQGELNKPKGSKSLSTHIKKATGLSGVKAALLRECLDDSAFNNMNLLAKSIKSLPLRLDTPRPIEEAISCAGGIGFDKLDKHLMVNSRPGMFLAGEMLDWDAPTGGYLLTACFALGKRAALGIKEYLATKRTQ